MKIRFSDIEDSATTEKNDLAEGDPAALLAEVPEEPAPQSSSPTFEPAQGDPVLFPTEIGTRLQQLQQHLANLRQRRRSVAVDPTKKKEVLHRPVVVQQVTQQVQTYTKPTALEESHWQSSQGNADRLQQEQRHLEHLRRQHDPPKQDPVLNEMRPQLGSQGREEETNAAATAMGEFQRIQTSLNYQKIEQQSLLEHIQKQQKQIQQLILAMHHQQERNARIDHHQKQQEQFQLQIQQQQLHKIEQLTRALEDHKKSQALVVSDLQWQIQRQEYQILQLYQTMEENHQGQVKLKEELPKIHRDPQQPELSEVYQIFSCSLPSSSNQQDFSSTLNKQIS